MKKLDDRKKGFEGKFVRDQDLEFKILARRNKYLGVWAAERLRITGGAVEDYCKEVIKAEGKIDWNNEASRIIGKVNGLYPVPGAFFVFRGERYKILKAEIGNLSGKIGEVLTDKLEIACAKNQSVKIVEIQKEGKKPQKILEFMLGSNIKKGSLISNA